MPIVTPTGLPAGVPDVVRTALPASGYDWGGGIVVDRRPAGGQRQVDRWGSTRSSGRRVFVGGYSRQFALREIGAAQYPGSGRDGLGVRGLAARRGWVVGLDEHYRSCPLTSPAPFAPKRGRGGAGFVLSADWRPMSLAKICCRVALFRCCGRCFMRLVVLVASVHRLPWFALVGYRQHRTALSRIRCAVLARYDAARCRRLTGWR